MITQITIVLILVIKYSCMFHVDFNYHEIAVSGYTLMFYLYFYKGFIFASIIERERNCDFLFASRAEEALQNGLYLRKKDFPPR